MKIRYVIIISLLLAVVFARCGKQGSVSAPLFAFYDGLLRVDSLMQSRPDSALVMLLDYQPPTSFQPADSTTVIATRAKRSGEISLVFNENYYQLLLAEALYKNDNPQLNRYRSETFPDASLHDAVCFFDSLAVSSPDDKETAFLSARSHYMNGVGFFENDSVVEACKEYLHTLDIMEEHLTNGRSSLQGYKAKFMGLTYTRLGELFFNYGVAKPALDSYKNALACFSRLSNYSLANTYRRIGCSYLLDNNNDSALYYYRKALCFAKKENKLSTYGASLSEISSIYYESGYADSAYLTIREALILPMNENQRLTRYHTLGTFFAKDCIYDSAIIYLEKSAKSDSYATRTVSAELLMKCYQALGDTVKMQYYKNLYGEGLSEYRNVMVTEDDLAKIHESYKQDKLQREHLKKNKETNCWQHSLFCFYNYCYCYNRYTF